MGFCLTPLLGDRRGFMPPQLKTKQTKKKTRILLVQNRFFLSLPVEKEIITNIVDSEFEIGEKTSDEF